MNDDEAMRRAIQVAASARCRTSPNPWVGCVIVTAQGVFDGATEPPGGRHAEIVALDAAAAAGIDGRGATLYTTLEPCSHQGRTGPCCEAIIAAGIGRVVSALEDPDPLVATISVPPAVRKSVTHRLPPKVVELHPDSSAGSIPSNGSTIRSTVRTHH